MALRGRRHIKTLYVRTVDGVEEERTEREGEEEIKTCDKCGEDATNRPPCRVCTLDLCKNHQIDIIHDIYDGAGNLKARSGVYCENCLVQLITGAYTEK